MSLPRYGPPDGNTELRAYADAVAQAFAIGFDDSLEMLRPMADNIRVLRDGEVQAGLLFYRMGQYFGGRSVPAWGVAGVAVPPHQRGKGYAAELMRAWLHEAHAARVAISPLYPAVPPLYRSLGWEFSGMRESLRVPVAGIQAPRMDITFRRETPEDDALVRELYAERHQGINGALDRDDAIWKRVRRAPEDSPLTGYIAMRGDKPVGYVLIQQKREDPTRLQYTLHLRDWAGCAPGFSDVLAGFIAGHRSMAREVTLHVPPGDPLQRRLLTSQDMPVNSRQAWMLRLVSVQQALEARGYNPTIRATATLQVNDEALPTNSGPWTLQLADGRMQAAPGGEGGAEINAQGLAALYAGYQTPTQLREAGNLQGHESQDHQLQAIFQGPTPWTPDFF